MPIIPQYTQTARINQWVSLADFTPGIYDNSYIAGITPVIPAPLGAADARYTQGCMALPNGGLGPLPKFTTTYSYATLTFATYGTMFLAQAFSTSSYFAGGGNADQFLIEFMGKTAAKVYWKCIQMEATTAVANLVFTGSGTVTAPFIGVNYPFMTRIANATPTTKPGSPVIVLSQSFVTAAALIGYTSIYPNITAPTLYEVLHLSAVRQGYSLGYQGRVLSLATQIYTWPGMLYGTNENINYTTPANSKTLKTQHVVLDPTDPYGYGSWGSISAGELFLVKNRGGGLVVTGDMNFPTVTKLPGVQSTGGVAGPGVQTPAGLIYCSQGNGAWLWNGGNISQKISQNIDDDFFMMPTYSLNFFAQPWGEWVLFSNSWLYNLRLQSWWKLSVPDLFWYYPSRNINQFFAMKQKISTATHIFGYKMTKNTPVTTWTWQSTPIKVAQNRYINIRELVLFASNPTTNTSTITIKLYNGPTQIFTYTTTVGQIGADPELIRIPAGGVTLDDIIVRITGTGAAGAPIVHSLTVGCTIRQRVQAT